MVQAGKIFPKEPIDIIGPYEGVLIIDIPLEEILLDESTWNDCIKLGDLISKNIVNFK